MSDGPNHQTKERTRPGILKIFWPAFLGWSATASFVAINAPGRVWTGTPHIRSELLWTFAGLVMVSPVAALAVALRYREARSPVGILINLTTLLLALEFLSELLTHW